MRPNQLTKVMAPLVWKYQSQLKRAARMEKHPRAINRNKMKYSDGSIGSVHFYGTGAVRVFGDRHVDYVAGQ